MGWRFAGTSCADRGAAANRARARVERRMDYESNSGSADCWRLSV
jgi:hypothetical protein